MSGTVTKYIQFERSTQQVECGCHEWLEKCQSIFNLLQDYAMAEMAGCSSLRETSALNPRPARVEFLVDVTLEQLLLKVLQFPLSASFCQSLSSIINPM
jgi:hypothetical protein